MRMLHGYFKSRTAQYFTPVNSSLCPLPFKSILSLLSPEISIVHSLTTQRSDIGFYALVVWLLIVKFNENN